MMNKQIKKIFSNKTILPLLIITFFCLLAYSSFIPFLGLYGDDWFFTYVGHFFGTEGLIQSKIMERPITGYSLALHYLLLGENVFLWHITMVIMIILNSFILFFTLKILWPNKPSLITLLTLLFLLYPGYLQQPSTVAYLPINTNLTLWTLSLTFTFLAIKTKNKLKSYLFIIVALILQIIAFMVLEYFVGMEILRVLLIIYLLISENIILPKFSFVTVKKIIIHSGPYIATLTLYIFWRIFLFKSNRDTTDLSWIAQTYYSDPKWLITRPLEMILSFLSIVVFPYFIPLIIRFIRIPLEHSIISLVIGGASSFIVYFYLQINEKTEGLSSQFGTKKFGKILFLIGSIAIIGALLPIVVPGRYVRPYITFDRYAVTSIIGAIFVLVGFLLWKLPSFFWKWAIMILISLSVTTHIMNGYFHAMNWQEQRNIWWQLYWRSSQIQSNAMLIFDFPKVVSNNVFKDIKNKVEWNRLYWVDYQIYGPGNLFFNYNKLTNNYFTGDYLQDKNVIEKINNKIIDTSDPMYDTYIKGFTSSRHYGNAIIITTPDDNSCLWVLEQDKTELPNHTTALLQSTIKYSDANKLVKSDSAAMPPSIIFGSEPSRNWCYYFQKASLARQLKDWVKINLLTEEVFEKNLTPNDVNEWLPFIEGLLISKNYAKAEELIKIGLNNNSSIFRSNICNMFSRLQKEDLNNEKISSLNNNFCK